MFYPFCHISKTTKTLDIIGQVLDLIFSYIWFIWLMILQIVSID